MIDSDYFYNPIKRDIAIVQGDTCSFGFQIQGLGGQRPSAINFSCKEKVEDEDSLFRVALTNNIDERSYDSERDILTYGVRIPPALTHNIPLGRYFYDLQAVVNGDVITLMKGRLSIDYQITRDTSPEPTPIEDGDNIYYPRTITDPTLQKKYTEKYVSDIAESVNELLGSSITGMMEPYKISELKTAIDGASADVVAASNAIKAISDITTDTILDDLATVISSLIWQGTQEEYDAITNINPHTLYIIVEEE